MCVLAQLFAGDLNVESFTLYQLMQNVASAVAFGYAVSVPMHGPHGTLAQVYMQWAVIGVSTVGFVLANRSVRHKGAGGGAAGHV